MIWVFKMIWSRPKAALPEPYHCLRNTAISIADVGLSRAFGGVFEAARQCFQKFTGELNLALELNGLPGGSPVSTMRASTIFATLMPGWELQRLIAAVRGEAAGSYTGVHD